MFKTVFSFFIFISALINFSYTQMVSVRTVMIAGFQNAGAAPDQSVSLDIVKSLQTQLKSIPGLKVISYDETIRLAQEQNYPPVLTNTEVLLRLGQLKRSGLIIYGSYRVDPRKRVISIDAVCLDVVTGQIILKRHFEGPSGIGLFDTLESVVAQFSGLLFSGVIETVPLSVTIETNGSSYGLYVNGQWRTNLTASQHVRLDLPVNEGYELILRSSADESEVYRKYFFIKSGETNSILYEPSGRLRIRNHFKDGLLQASSGQVLESKKNGPDVLWSLPAGSPVVITFQAGTELYYIRQISSIESREEILDITALMPVRIYDYRKSSPVMGLLIPGFPQYQSGDLLPGVLSSLSAFTGLASMIFFIWGASVMDQSLALPGNSPDRIAKINEIKSSCIWISVISGTAWLTAALFSWAHAANQPSLQIGIQAGPSAYIPDGIILAGLWRF